MEISIGRKVRAWRNERGFTQVQLAEKSNISRSYLAGIETGRYKPSIDTLQDIANSLNINIAYLLEDTKLGPMTASIYIDDPECEDDAEKENPATETGSGTQKEDLYLLKQFHEADESTKAAIRLLLKL